MWCLFTLSLSTFSSRIKCLNFKYSSLVTKLRKDIDIYLSFHEHQKKKKKQLLKGELKLLDTFLYMFFRCLMYII